jgi:hypothetical protein
MKFLLKKIKPNRKIFNYMTNSKESTIKEVLVFNKLTCLKHLIFIVSFIPFLTIFVVV